MNRRSILLALAASGAGHRGLNAAVPDEWRSGWPRTDFQRHVVDAREIRSGGPPRDGIPSIDEPRFVPLREARGLDAREPVLALIVGGDARAYPLRVLIWHAIVNDTVGGLPVVVTYCPLCNTALVSERRVDGRLLSFGTTGKLRHSDLVIYDRQTESWWPQYGGVGILGAHAGIRLRAVPACLEGLDSFRARAPQGRLLVPNDARFRDYGANPYIGYDEAPRPFLFDGEPPPTGVEPMMRVVAVGPEAWALQLLRAHGRIEAGGLTLTWQPGQRTALGAARIAQGAEVGNVTVRRGQEDVVHTIPFAFAFFAFNPNGVLHTINGDVRR